MNTHQQNVSGKTPFQPFYLPKRTLQEHNRLTFQHHVLRTALGGNFLAPCAHPAAILDVVCGTGAWTADMGKLFPKAEIMGMDIVSPSCPQSPHFQFIEGRTPLALPFIPVCLYTSCKSFNYRASKRENKRGKRSKATTKMANHIYIINGAKNSERDCEMCRCLEEPCSKDDSSL
jgi:hypothetical protein